MSHRVLLTTAAILAISSVAHAAPTFLGPTPYLSPADSPLSPARLLENFEDGLLNTPGVSMSPGAVVLGPSPLTDSVDADDGAIDGSGTNGHSLLVNAANSLTFTFDPSSPLPTQAGIVWTDVGQTTGAPGVAPVTFEAFGPAGLSLGSIGPFTLGDGSVTGATAEDRFFGVTNPDGISAITISLPTSTDWEIDHLQFVIPEPASLALLSLAFATLNRRPHRRPR